jgi:hypothetical protein
MSSLTCPRGARGLSRPPQHSPPTDPGRDYCMLSQNAASRCRGRAPVRQIGQVVGAPLRCYCTVVVLYRSGGPPFLCDAPSVTSSTRQTSGGHCLAHVERKGIVMAVECNRTTVAARDNVVAATVLTDLLGLPAPNPSLPQRLRQLNQPAYTETVAKAI